MSEELRAMSAKLWDKREGIVAKAKKHGVTAQFHVDLVAISRAIDRAKNAEVSGDPSEVSASLAELRDLSKDET